MELEEDRFIAIFHQQVQKEREKAYHDRHINKKLFKQGDLVLLYETSWNHLAFPLFVDTCVMQPSYCYFG